jgi:uncharacterized protein YjiS (DUF1127 family)
MTNTTTSPRPDRGIARRFWLWLPQWRRGRRQAKPFDSLSDHMRADIGMDHDAIRRTGPRTLHEAMRYSG